MKKLLIVGLLISSLGAVGCSLKDVEDKVVEGENLTTSEEIEKEDIDSPQEEKKEEKEKLPEVTKSEQIIKSNQNIDKNKEINDKLLAGIQELADKYNLKGDLTVGENEIDYEGYTSAFSAVDCRSISYKFDEDTGYFHLEVELFMPYWSREDGYPVEDSIVYGIRDIVLPDLPVPEGFHMKIYDYYSKEERGVVSADYFRFEDMDGYERLSYDETSLRYSITLE